VRVSAPFELDREAVAGELLTPVTPERLADLKIRAILSMLCRPTLCPPRTFRRSRWRLAAIALAVAAFLVARWQLTASDEWKGELLAGRYKVARVLNGSTIELSPHLEVRLLGIEEFSRSGVEVSDSSLHRRSATALDFAQRFIADGEVRLQFDRTRIDSAGRYLAYVWVDGSSGSRMLNEELLRAGLCRALAGSPCSATMKRRLAVASEQARRDGRGLWAKN
jgi:endonuclease YncB( thermonuclease family)